MIKKLEVRGVHMHIDPKLFKYATKKIGKLDHYIPRHARESAHAEVILKEEKLKTKTNFVVEVIMHLPNDTLTVKESTMNAYAAIDIVEAKLKSQFKKYKSVHGSPQLHHRLIRKLRNIKHQV